MVHDRTAAREAWAWPHRADVQSCLRAIRGYALAIPLALLPQPPYYLGRHLTSSLSSVRCAENSLCPALEGESGQKQGKRPNPARIGPVSCVGWIVCDASIGAVVHPPDQVGNTPF
jgi:hypothetical protein